MLAATPSCQVCRSVFRRGHRSCPNDGARLVFDGTDPLIGSVLDGRYRVEALIGEGGLGRVYQAVHVRMSRRFAVKVPFGEVASDPALRQRFALEAELTSRMSHPNVIGVLDVGVSGEGLLYLVMELADGVSLHSLIDDGPMPRDRAVTIAAQIAAALAHAHGHGIVHRDLKPENVLVGARDRVRVIDFGIAVAPASGVRLTDAGTFVGTPSYMAPEALEGTVDARSDLFALGLILYELLAGVAPFEGEPLEVAWCLQSQPIPPIARRAGVAADPQLEALAMWLLEKRPEHRPPDAATVHALLKRILSVAS